MNNLNNLSNKVRRVLAKLVQLLSMKVKLVTTKFNKLLDASSVGTLEGYEDIFNLRK